MSHKIEKSKAFKLFCKGWTPPETASHLNVNLRTVQRWHKEFLGQNPDLAVVGKVPVSVIPINEISVSTHLAEAIEDTVNHSSSFSRDWVTWANSLTNSHLETHRKVSEKLSKILIASLDAPEHNTRLINVFSQCLCRHLDAERETGFLDMLVTDAAFKKVESMGYEISAPPLAPESESP